MSETSVDRFRTEARAFLDANAVRRPPRAGRFEWGEGSDEVALFAEPSADEEQRELDDARAWRRKRFDAGFGWISGPGDLGGRDLPQQYERAYAELERDYVVPNPAPLSIGLGMVAPTILTHGGDAAKRRWLPALHRGDAVGCQLFSEPGAGSDLASVTTAAVEQGGGWIIDGQKVWSSGAHYSDVGLLLARTSRGPRHRNLTAFLVDMDAPGVEVRPLRQMTGGSAFNEVFLDGVEVRDSARLGEVDGGWRVAITTLMNERATVGGAAGTGTGLLSHGRLIALARHVGRDKDPVVRQLLAQLYIDLTVRRYNVRRAAARRRAGHPPGPEASMTKVAVTDAMQSISRLVSELLGPALVADSGAWGTYAWSEFVLGVPGMRLGGGTEEILRTVTAERVLGLPKEPTSNE